MRYARVRAQDHLDRLLGGEPFDQLNPHAILEHDKVEPPDGVSSNDFGHPAIHSFDEALRVAKAARANPLSDMRTKGFTETTPIYYFRSGQPAEEQV